jgi:hypothetical protein
MAQNNWIFKLKHMMNDVQKSQAAPACQTEKKSIEGR